MTRASELIHCALQFGMRSELDGEWKNLLFDAGSPDMPRQLYEELKIRRDEIAAYLVGRELKNWLGRWQPPMRSRMQ